MKLFELREEKPKKISPFLNKITQLIFKQGADWVHDKKRSKEAIFLGVANTESLVTDPKGKRLKLTFDNSTSSGEFELNSLSPLMIEKGSMLDGELLALFDKHHVKSVKKINYITKEGKTVIREIHVGKELGPDEVKFVGDMLHLFASRTSRTSE